MAEDAHEHAISDPSHLLPAQASPDRTPDPNAPPKRHNPVTRLLIWVAVLVVFGLAFFWVLHHKNVTTAQSARSARGAAGGTVPVVPATAQQGDIGVYQEAIGTVTPVYTSSITAQVTGVIVAVHYHEGQLVHKGQPLIDLDARQYEANLAAAEGTLAHDENLLEEARMDLQRYRQALARNAIARQTVEDQEKLVLQDEGTVKQDQGTVAYDKVQVSFCHITAPITGRVGLRLVDPGNLVTANGTNPLVVITQVQPITVIFTLAEDALGQVVPRVRSRAKLPVETYDRNAQQKITTGTLISLDNQVDTTTGTVKARAQFDNRNGELYPNEFVNTRLLVNTLHNVTLIPSSAVQHNGQNTFVYVLNNGTARTQPIKVGVTNGDTSQATGITPGQVVANSSFDKLQTGAKVRLTNAGAAPASPQKDATP